MTLTTQQQKLLAELHGLEDQIRKGHYLNVHFRAFQLANEAWQEHIRQNAIHGNRAGPGSSPPGALLDEDAARKDPP